VNEPAYTLTIGAESAVATTVTPNSVSTPTVKTRCAYASPWSASRLAARTSSGTITLVKTPPSMR
jgi:hypothetical protein